MNCMCVYDPIDLKFGMEVLFALEQFGIAFGLDPPSGFVARPQNR